MTPRTIASDFMRWGLSPAATRSAAALWGPTPDGARSAGLALAQRRRISVSSSAIPVSRVRYRRARCRSALFAYAVVVCASPGRQRTQVLTIALILEPQRRCLTCSGAVVRRAWIWLAAWARALTAERRASGFGSLGEIGQLVPVQPLRFETSGQLVSRLPPGCQQGLGATLHPARAWALSSGTWTPGPSLR